MDFAKSPLLTQRTHTLQTDRWKCDLSSGACTSITCYKTTSKSRSYIYTLLIKTANNRATQTSFIHNRDEDLRHEKRVKSQLELLL